MTASGTFGYGMEYSRIMDIQRLGAIICKGTTLEPREGNQQPRLVETVGGVLNSIGLQNIGVVERVAVESPDRSRIDPDLGFLRAAEQVL